MHEYKRLNIYVCIYCKTCKTTKLLYAVPCFCIKAAVTSLDTAYLWFQKKIPKTLERFFETVSFEKKFG